MSKKTTPQNALYPASEWENGKLYRACLDFITITKTQEFKIATVLLQPNQKITTTFGDRAINGLIRDEDSHILVLQPASLTRDLSVDLDNKNNIIEQPARHWHFLTLPENEPATGWEDWLKAGTSDWFCSVDSAEVNHSMAVRSQVFLNYLDDASSGNIVDEATLFLAGNGLKQQALLAQLDEIKRHFRSQIGSKVGERRQYFLKPLLDFLKAKDLNEQNKYHALSTTALDYLYNEGAVRTSFSAANARSLPRVLVLAESGTGKTAVTQYLARRTSPDGGKLSRPVKRIAIPDYLSNTGTLEYDLFGFMKGAYTSAPEEGSPGALLSNIGGIIFLDEIGDASPVIQAKLLAFMDDYKVSPRGWSREGFFCPVMIVAATNRPIDQWAAQDEQETLPDGHPRFRHDLFQRFNIVIRLPNLNERKDSELPALVDALLQTYSVNPCNRITNISYKALEKLQTVNYQRANFRLLSRLLAQACSKASPRAEKTICSSDITLEADHDYTKAC